ncbi:MAG: hypothetical protein ACTSQA_00190 [Candidatus Heimdallarchaeaceae archaeon]
MPLLCKVVIDGVTVRDDSSTEKKVLSWEYERTSDVVISQLAMTLLSSVEDLVSLKVGQVIQVWTGFITSTDKKVFSGFIAEISPDGGRVDLTCYDKMWDLVRKNVNTVYESSGPQAGVISDIAKDLIETHGGLTASVVATGTIEGKTIGEFRCTHTDIWERLTALAKAVEYQIFYDPVNDTVHFEPKGYSDSTLTLTVGTQILGVPKWTNDTSRMVNDLRVDGAVSQTQIRLPNGTEYGTIGTTANFDTDGILLDKTPENVELILDSSTPPVTVKIGGTKDSTTGHYYYVDRENKKIIPTEGTSFPTENAIVNYTWLAPSPIHQISQDSIDTYGTWEKQITLTDIQTVADAEARTAELLSKFSVPFLIGDLLVRSSSTISLNVGDRVKIVDSVSTPNINKELIITKQVIKYPGSNQEITVGDEAIRLADWQINVEERLKRIEEQLSLKNQDLILELRDFYNEVQISPRYRKLQTRDTSTDALWDRETWDNSEWDEDYDNSMIDNFVEQFENIYTEDFIDQDFEDDSGTATWASGSLDFTSGQVALSKSIDLRNGVITSIDVDIDIESGSVLIEVTADNSNWETATNNTTHTFSNTGQDLRFRLTENNTSTAEVNHVKFSNIH